MINNRDKDFIINNSLNMTINQMFEFFHNIYTKEQLKNYCKNNQITYKKLSTEERLKIARNRRDIKQRQQTPINHDYFKTWSRNMAYIFGLWCADGNIDTQNKGYQFSIKLHKNDKYLLQQILNEMKSEHKIYECKDNSCQFIIGSKTIVSDIIKLGGKERKSLDLEFPKVPNEYLFDFIRGNLDGDGTVIQTYNRVGFIGSFEFITSLKLILNGYNINTGKIHDKHKNDKKCKGHLFCINIGSKDSLKKLYELLYSDIENTMYLNRKYNIFSNYKLDRNVL